MIEVALSGIVILLISLTWGFLVTSVVRGITKESFELRIEFIIILGIAFLTAYAQFISLFGEVSGAAFMLAEAIGLAGLILTYKDMISTFRGLIFNKRFRSSLILILMLGLIFVALSATEVKTYDTMLYHAQAIKWIEEYGVVKGLGNLHHRLAYNSSFFSLQALFSLHWFVDGSMRSMNGFLCWILTSWAVCTLKGLDDMKFHITDLLRLLLIYNILVDMVTNISGCSSDLFVLNLVIYIFISWMEYSSIENHYIHFCLLAVVCAFALTLKLSAASMVAMVIAPATYLIKNKKYRDIILFLSMGLVVVVPFLIRNVLISGYLLYPYPSLDLFPVDWKMNPYVCKLDAAEIKIWGRGITDVDKILTPFKEWFPIWMNSMSKPMLVLFFINLLMIPVIVFWLRYDLKKMKNEGISIELILVPIVAYFNMGLWFVGAPLPRYGGIYILICFLCTMGTVGYYFSQFFLQKIKIDRVTGYINYIICCAISVMVVYAVGYVYGEDVNLDKQPDIWSAHAEKVPLGDECEIYVPIEDGEDRLGYASFPSTPYRNMLDKIELYGDTVGSGFRVRDEYQDSLLSTTGMIYETDIFLE